MIDKEKIRNRKFNLFSNKFYIVKSASIHINITDKFKGNDKIRKFVFISIDVRNSKFRSTLRRIEYVLNILCVKIAQWQFITGVTLN